MELWTSACFGLVVLIGTISEPPHPRHPNNTPAAYLAVLDKAHRANASDAASVRALVDAIFDAGTFAGMPESVRDRVSRADLAHRRGEARGITEADIVSAVNSAAWMAAAPDFAKTSVEQLRGYREIARAMVPFIGSENGVPRAASQEMSPSEAVFLLTALATQKLLNPEYKVSPAEWTMRFSAKKQAAQKKPDGDSAKVSHSMRAEIADQDSADVLRVLHNDLKDESSFVVTGIHLFLDQLGIAR